MAKGRSLCCCAGEGGLRDDSLYMSGATGRSKGSLLSHDNLASNSLSLVDYDKGAIDMVEARAAIY